MLKNEGYAVGVAENGQQAINKSKTSLYDLAFVGLRLLDMDGTQLLMAMRKATPGMSR
jgi:DNA-binding response OmpR family regulator